MRQAWDVDPAVGYCRRCGTTAPVESVTDSGCGACRDRRVPWDRVTRLGAYEPPLSDWVVACKFHADWAQARWFGHRLAEAVADAASPDWVVPVPLHWRRRLVRGYDQAALIGRALAGRLGVPLARVLRRRRPTRSQADSGSVTQRRADLSGAFATVKADLSDGNILLVDDVCTTGATAAQCTQQLRRAGAGRIHLAVVAVAGPRAGLLKI